MEFPGEGPEIDGRLIAAEALLGKELRAGSVSGHETAGGWGRLFFVTGSPMSCLAEIDQRLEALHLSPTITTCQGAIVSAEG